MGPSSPAALLVAGRCRWVTGWPYDMAASMAHRQWAMVMWLRWCSWAGAWFDSGYMFQRLRTVEVPLLVHRQSGGYCSYLQRQVHTVSNCASRRLPCHGAEDVSLGLVSRPRRFPSCSTLIRCSMSLLRSSSRFLRSRGRRSRSHSCSSYSLDQVVARPLRATTDAYGCRSSSTILDVPVIMRDSGNAPDSVHRGYGGHSSSQQRQVLDLTVAAMMGLFGAFCVIFRAPRVIPEPSSSFSSFRALTQL